MSYINNSQAFCLANTYGFSPPRKVYKAINRRTDSGKFEPDRNLTATTRTMCLAHWFDKTNILVQYNPADLEI